MPPRNYVRALLPSVLVLATTLFLHARSRPEHLVPRSPLREFPMQISDWRGREIGITQDVREVLGDGDFMDRLYGSAQGTAPPVDLFVAYFPTQRTGSTMHSPKNCLPGSGWTPVMSDRFLLAAPDGRRVEANRYVVARGEDRQLVLYWYQSHGRFIASEYTAKIRLVLDSISMNRSDGALVRLVTPIAREESVDHAAARTAEFAAVVLPRLDPYIPR